MAMGIKCPNCGYINPPGTSYCEKCGAELQAASPAAQAATQVVAPAPSVSYTLSFRGISLEFSDDMKTFGRKDFIPYLPESEYMYISRKHFTIFREGDKFYIQDEGSTNGTKVNGVEIKGKGRVELKDGDKILVAEILEIEFKVKKTP